MTSVQRCPFMAAARVPRECGRCRGRASRAGANEADGPFSAARAVADELEQVTVGIEEVQAVVVAPVDGGGMGDAPRRKQTPAPLQILPRDLEGLVGLPQGGLELLQPA